MQFDATGFVMLTLCKRLLSRVFGGGTPLLIFLVIVVVVGSLVIDRASSRGMNVSLSVANVLSVSATAPTPSTQASSDAR
jgi:hypothetical protein